MKYLISTVETYRIDTEAEVEQMIADAKDDNRFVLTKYNCEHKDVKEKGDIIGEYFKVTLKWQINANRDGEFWHKNILI